MVRQPKPLSRLDQLLAGHVAALTVLGALIVGLRHGIPWLPAAAAVAALGAIVVTDWWGVIRLNRWFANAITIVAVAWSLRDFWDLSSEEKLMAIGSMLCLLQMVLLFQEKTSRIYWHLVVLSVLEVVVAAALDLGPSFVPLLTLYLAVGLGTLTLLCVYRETARARTGNWELAKWIAKRWQAAVGRPLPTTRASGADPAVATGIRSAREGKADSAAAAKLLLGRAVVESKPSDDATLNQCFTTRLLVRQIGLLTTATMLFAVVFFFATPRLRDGFSPTGFFFGGPTMDFRSEVRLQRKGRIHLSSRPVMRVKLSRLLDQRTIELASEDEPYFHGAILPEYVSDAEGSRWVRPQSGGRGILRAVAQTTRSLVRQDIVVEPNVSRRFAIQPTQSIEDPTAVYGSGQGASDRAQQQRYALATPAILNERQVKAIPNPNRRRNEDEEAAFRDELITTTRFPAERFPRLAKVAAEVLEQNQLTDARPFDKAVALERHFLTLGQYDYSLNLNLSADESIDPIEDFVANSRSGNCEYFASALAMMLRSQDIPARLVRGYKGGTFNTVGRYYLVQERDAHSWVEAWMPNEAVSNELAGAPSDGGAWYRFDPTPGRGARLSIEQPGMGERIAQAFDYVELLWRDYVLSLNTARQDEIVYDPLTARAGALPQWVEMRQLRNWLRRAGAVMGLDSFSRGGRPSRVFESTTAVAVILALLFLAAAIYGARAAWAAITNGRQSPPTAVNAAPEFYRRLERTMARLVVVRKSTETPREMAVAASERLAKIPLHAAIAALPGDLVTAYYRVRFGRGRLDKVESEAIEQALKKIELAVQRTR